MKCRNFCYEENSGLRHGGKYVVPKGPQHSPSVKKKRGGLDRVSSPGNLVNKSLEPSLGQYLLVRI